jgi:hypothetical protein
MARLATHVLAALTQAVMDTSLWPKKNSNYVLSNGGDLGDYFLFFPLYLSHTQAMNPKVCKISHKKTHLLTGEI